MSDSPHQHGAAHTPDWDLLARYLAGESDVAERERVQRTLADNPEGAALVRLLSAGWRAPEIEPLAPAAVDAALVAVMAKRGTEVTPLHAPSRRFLVPMRAAAALLVIIGGTLVWRSMQPVDTTAANRTAPLSARTFASTVGALDSLRLPDGSQVVLGPGSSIDLAADYGGSTRAVTLRGQAMFDVKHDATRPFVVTAGGAELRDVGTVFMVESGERGAMRVVVTEGALAVRRAGVTLPADTLKAGDLATMPANGAIVVARGAASTDDRAWLERRLVLRNAPLPQVVDDLRRWFGLELRVADSSLMARHLTATFENEWRADVGRLVAAALGAGVTQSGDTVWIRPTGGARER